MDTLRYVMVVQITNELSKALIVRAVGEFQIDEWPGTFIGMGEMGKEDERALALLGMYQLLFFFSLSLHWLIVFALILELYVCVWLLLQTSLRGIDGARPDQTRRDENRLISSNAEVTNHFTGAPVSAPIAYMLIQHKADFKNLRVVGVRAFLTTDRIRKACLLWYIKGAAPDPWESANRANLTDTGT